MAIDLLFGKTSRDWSCGYYHKDEKLATEVKADTSAKRDVAKIGPAARAEVQQNINKMVQLSSAGRVPEVERKAFGKFLEKWFAFALPRDGKFRGEDYVALSNFREANRRFAERLAVFEKMAATPLVKSPLAPAPPATPPAALVTAPRTGWVALVIGALLGAAGLGFLVRRSP